MTYSPHTWQPGEIISSARLNALEQGVAAGGGGGYDLVLKVPQGENFSAANVEVVSGSILDCEQKVADGEPVNAVLIITSAWSWTPSSANAPNNEFVFPLTYWHCPYCWIVFSGLTSNSNEQRTVITAQAINIGYDPDDGSILTINWPYSILQ